MSDEREKEGETGPEEEDLSGQGYDTPFFNPAADGQEEGLVTKAANKILGFLIGGGTRY